MGCIGALLVLFACYIYIQFYDYDRCEYYSNTYHKWFTDAIDVDKYTQRVGRLIAKDAIKRANRKLIIGIVMIVISFFFVPSESKLYVIYGIGNTIDYIRTNDKAKQLPDKAINCIYKYLDEHSKKMIIVTQTQLKNKDTEAIILLRNEIKASFNTNAIDYFTISAVAEILYNKFKHKNHDIIYHTIVSYGYC